MKKYVYCLLVILFAFTSQHSTYAKEKGVDRKILIIFSSDEKDDRTQLRIVDTLIGHFSNNITIKNDEEFKSDKIDNDFTDVIYLSTVQKQLSKNVTDFVEQFHGNVLTIGKNIEQFPNRYSFIKINGETIIQTITSNVNQLEDALPEDRVVMTIETDRSSKVLLEGKTKEGQVAPLLVKKDQSYYLATESLTNVLVIFITCKNDYKYYKKVCILAKQSFTISSGACPFTRKLQTCQSKLFT